MVCLVYYIDLWKAQDLNSPECKTEKNDFKNLPLACVFSVMANTMSYISQKTTKLTQDIWPHDKTDVYCYKNDNNSLLPQN